MIGASDRSWNSATTLYIARSLEALANGRKLAVLDMGCGEGIVMEQLVEYGHDFYGYDLDARFETLRKRLGHRFPTDFDQRFRVAAKERSIPFPDATFDVVYANQVFEHVRFIDALFAEAARVLKPGGVMIALFPLATYPIELHVKLPFAHWIPPGRLRYLYLRTCFTLRLGARTRKTSRECAEYWEQYLRECCFYRFHNEILALGTYYFEAMDDEAAQYIQARIDLSKASRSMLGRMKGRLLSAFNGRAMSYFVQNFFGATFVMRNPRTQRAANPSAATYKEHWVR